MTAKQKQYFHRKLIRGADLDHADIMLLILEANALGIIEGLKEVDTAINAIAKDNSVGKKHE